MKYFILTLFMTAKIWAGDNTLGTDFNINEEMSPLISPDNNELSSLNTLSTSSKTTLKNYYKTLPPQNRWGDFLRNRIASLHYLFSVAGYGLANKEVYNFLNNYFSQKASWRKFDFSITINVENHSSLLNAEEHNPILDIIKSDLLSLENMAESKHEFNIKMLKLSIEHEKRNLDSFLQSEQFARANAIKKLKELKDSIKAEENRFLDELKKNVGYITSHNFFKEKSEIIKIMVLPMNVSSPNVKSDLLYMYPFDLKGKNTKVPAELINFYLQQFPSKNLILYCLMHDTEHLVYAKIDLDPLNKFLRVSVYDPTISFNETRTESYNYFSKIASEIGFSFSHDYQSVNHQILNGHDCGRFSIVYLLYDLELNKSPLSLSAQDVYYGMKIIEKNGLEEFMGQTKSKFAEYTDYLRAIPKYFLSEPPENKPNLLFVNQPKVYMYNQASHTQPLNQ